MNSLADFHNHTCLSPCASLELSPKILVNLASQRGVQILALTDHNSALNTPTFEKLCKSEDILPLCGLEVTTVEELHCLCLFESAETALAFGDKIASSLLKIPNRPESWGDQPWVDENDLIMGEVDYWLGAASSYSLTDLGRLCHEFSGLWIPAHIDRPTQSVTSQLGYLPPDEYDALEVRENAGHLEILDLPLVRGSDAHYPENVATRTCRLELEQMSFNAVKDALKRRRVSAF
ncbi:MAG: PHP domain-containing protein [Spirochaetales bacterium]|nr:PHP domain-containing protein [Spirochaetales bacterium]